MSAPTTPAPSRATRRRRTIRAAALAAEVTGAQPTAPTAPTAEVAEVAPAAPAPAASRAASFAAKFRKQSAADVPASVAPVDSAADGPVSSGPARSLMKRRRRAPAPAPAPGVGRVAAAAANPRVRWLCFNATAAGAGHLAVWSVTGDPMAGAELMGRMTVSVPQLAAAGLTLAAAYGGWRAGGLLKGLPGLYGMAARPAAALGAALWGQGTAPLVRDVLDAIEPWGTLLSPLLAAGPLAAACWWGLDRRARTAQLIPPVRWLARVPLATLTLASLLYAPGALL